MLKDDLIQSSVIAESIPFEYLSIKHLGMLKNGVEDFDNEETKASAGALENYTLKKIEGKTELLVDIDIAESEKEHFLKSWPLALEKVKELAENS